MRAKLFTRHGFVCVGRSSSSEELKKELKSYNKLLSPNFFMIEENEETKDISSTLVRSFLSKNKFEELGQENLLNEKVLVYIQQNFDSIHLKEF